MLGGTHVEIGLNTWAILSADEKALLDEKSFLKGNVLPDIHPSYRVRKHRLKQFEGKVTKKITYLSNLTSENIGNDLSSKKLSRELGIICHFLSDFFCMPHSQWGVKESFNLNHVKYEKRLHKHLNIFTPIKDSYTILDEEDCRNFISICLKKHKLNSNYENDLYYAMYVCNSVIKYILKNIIKEDNKFT